VNWDLRGGRVRRSGLLKRAAALTVAERSEAEWGRVRAAILRAIEPFAAAKDAVYAALLELCEAPEDAPA
jgi:hypothetical protein